MNEEEHRVSAHQTSEGCPYPDCPYGSEQTRKGQTTWTKILIAAVLAPLLAAVLWMIQVAGATQVEIARLKTASSYTDQRLGRIEEKLDIVLQNQRLIRGEKAGAGRYQEERSMP